MKVITLTEDEWIDQFKPIPNAGIKEGLDSGWDLVMGLVYGRHTVMTLKK